MAGERRHGRDLSIELCLIEGKAKERAVKRADGGVCTKCPPKKENRETRNEQKRKKKMKLERSYHKRKTSDTKDRKVTEYHRGTRGIKEVTTNSPIDPTFEKVIGAKPNEASYG